MGGVFYLASSVFSLAVSSASWLMRFCWASLSALAFCFSSTSPSRCWLISCWRERETGQTGEGNSYSHYRSRPQTVTCALAFQRFRSSSRILWSACREPFFSDSWDREWCRGLMSNCSFLT